MPIQTTAPPKAPRLRPASDPIDATLLPAFMLPLAMSGLQPSPEGDSSQSSLVVLLEPSSAQVSGASVIIGSQLAEGNSNMPSRTPRPPRAPQLRPSPDPIDVTSLPAFMLPPALGTQQLPEEGPFSLSPTSEPPDRFMEWSVLTPPAAPIVQPQEDPFDSALLPDLVLEPAESLCEASLDDENDQTVSVFTGFDKQITNFSDATTCDTPRLITFPWSEEPPIFPRLSCCEEEERCKESFSRSGFSHKNLYTKLLISSPCSTRASTPSLQEGASLLVLRNISGPECVGSGFEFEQSASTAIAAHCRLGLERE